MSKMTLDIYSCDCCGYSEHIKPGKAPFKLKQYVIPFVDRESGDAEAREIHLCPKCAKKMAIEASKIFSKTALWLLGAECNAKKDNREGEDFQNG